MNLIKFIPSSIRKMIFTAVVEEIREQTKLESVTGYVVAGVDRAISSTTKGVSDARMAQICNGCTVGGNALVHLAEAVHPESEGGKVITTTEAEVIKSDIINAMGDLVPQSAIDGIVGKVEEKIKGYLLLN